VVESEDHLTDFGDDGDGRDDDNDDDNVDDNNDDNEDEEGEGENDSDYSSDTEGAGGLEGNEGGRVMCLYMKAIRKQIQEESTVRTASLMSQYKKTGLLCYGDLDIFLRTMKFLRLSSIISLSL